MNETLDTLNSNIWLCDFAALGIFTAVVLKTKKVNSNFVTASIVMLLSGVIIQYGKLVESLVSPIVSTQAFTLWCTGFALFDLLLGYLLYNKYQQIKGDLNTLQRWGFSLFAMAFVVSMTISQFGPLLFGSDGITHITWIRVLTYLVNTLLDVLVIFSIHRAHQFARLKYSFISKMYLLAFFVAGCLHVFRFVERYTWNSDFLSAVYTWGLVSINLSTTTVVVVISYLAWRQCYRKEIG